MDNNIGQNIVLKMQYMYIYFPHLYKDPFFIHKNIFAIAINKLNKQAFGRVTKKYPAEITEFNSVL